jgi:uncharacterized membrane protein
MIYIILGLIGAAAGSFYLRGPGDFIIGGVVGLLVAAVISQRNGLLAVQKRLKDMEGQIADLLAGQKSDPAAEQAETAPVPQKPGQTAPAETAAMAAEAETPSATPRRTVDMPSLELKLPDEIDAPSPPEKPPEPDLPPPEAARPVDRIREFFLGGNLVVRVGVVVLLFGFAFLVKYAAAQDLVPLEIRLAAAFVAGVGLLVLGWRLRRKRFGYAVTLQGGGIGVMYLTVFAAARLFHLVPLPLTFVVMVGLVVFSGILAVLQNAAAMAVLGAAGGFMAPVLLSTGTGSHITLFSYYALLNAGIFGIAWFKAWRWLNLLGFVFTFGIGSAWGIRYYQPEYFATTEPFLILFFVFYLAISLRFALRQPPRLKGYVDSTLVFGMPLVVFSLQVGLVREMQYGLAFSALVLGLVYIGLATTLWRRRAQGLAALAEAFLSLGVVFGSLAIPLALSGRWTTVAWSLEGAGLVWVGCRQNRWTARTFGLLLQLGSGAFFLFGSHGTGTGMAVFNNRFLGGMLVGLAGLVTAFFLERYQQRLHRLEKPLAMLSLAWGLLWWLGTGLDEIDRRLGHRHEQVASLAYVGLSGLAMGLLYRRLDWQKLRWPCLGLLPAMGLSALALADYSYFKHPFQGWWLAVWPLTFAVHLFLLFLMDTAWPRKIAAAWHVIGILLATLLIAWETGWLLDWLAGGAYVWAYIAWGGITAAIVVLLSRLKKQPGWPFAPWRSAYRGWAPAVLILGLLAWTFGGLTLTGNPRPLPYLPLFNPLDLVQFFVFLVLFRWTLETRNEPVEPAASLAPAALWTGPAAGLFLWLTAVVARTVHHLADVRYTTAALFRSDLFQSSVAVLWGLLALGCMISANRLKLRPVWFTGAGLLGVVVIKLFLVDLSGSGTVFRIVSFLAVGGLMLVIGFFTPLPPADSKGERP